MSVFSKKSNSKTNHSFSSKDKSEDTFFGVQAKLNIGKSNDKYEVEADKMADTVVAKKQTNNADTFFNPSPIVQQKQAKEVQKKEETEIQEKPLAQSITPIVQKTSEEKEEVQMRSNNDAQTEATSTIENKLENSKTGGSSLQENTKTEMESGFGADFSKVRIHSDSNAVQMNKELGSQAFANGNNIYFNEGKYNPNSQDGKHLLAHELTHTVQQGASKPSVQKKETPDVAVPKPTPTAETQTPVKTQSETKTTAQPVVESKVQNPAENANAAPAKQEEKGVENETATPNSASSVAAANPTASTPNSSTTAQEAPAVEEKTVEEPTKTEEKTPEIPAEGKKEEAAEIAEEPSIERDPTANPAFQSVVAGIGTTAKQQKDNDPAEQLSADAQAAAPSPSNERGSQAQANQVDEMEAQEPQVFSAEAFKAQLMARIAEMKLPKNNEEADEFEDHNNIDEVNKKATEDVKKEKATAAGPIDQTTNKEPNTDAVPERTEMPLPPLKQAPKPGSVGATKAIPDKRPDSEVVKPIEEDTARMDQTMAENKVTDEQLEKSEEPTFQEALGKKNEAKTTAQAAPISLREQENAVLQKNASGAENASQKELEGMNLLRGTALQGVGTTQADSSSKDTSERQRIADQINAIYEKTKNDVTTILDTLETTVTEKFEAEAKTAKGKFEEYVDEKMSMYKARRYSGITGGLQWGYDLFAGLPDEVNVFFTEGREVFVNHMDGAITVIANIVATELTLAKNRIEIGKQEVTDYVNELPTNQKKFGKEAADDIQDKFDSLKDDVNSKQDSLVDSLAQQYSDSLGEVDARIEEMKAANKGLIDAAIGFINGIIETIKKLRDLVSSLLSAIASVIEVIIAAPIEFMGNLFKGIGQGIDLFKANIQKHLLGGLLEWLTGSLGPMGITVPDDIFSLPGIFNLLMQVLGLGWDNIRLKAVKIMGEPTVKVMETGYDMFKAFATKGIDGIWEYLQESFTDLKETVIDAIKNMLITQVIEAGIKWLLSLLIPGAGFIKAIMAIKDVIVFFVESAIMLIPAIIEGILALAAGSVAGVAKAIEFGLARLIPLVIGLFAKLIGLGGLSKKVMKIFTNIRKRIDKAVMKLLMKAKAAGRKLLGKVGLTKPTKEKKGEEFKNDPAKQNKIDAGLADLNKEEKKYLSSGKISKEEAVQVAKAIKGRHSIFSSFKVVDGKDSWDYVYTASPPVVVQGEPKDDEDKVDGQLLNNSAIHSKTDMTISEPRKGKEIVGYKAKEPESSAKFDGVIVGKTGSEKAYIKERNEKKDYAEEFNKLKGLSVEDRRKIINKGAGEHSDFKPEKIKISSSSEGTITVTYYYSNEAHNAGQQDFSINISISDIDKRKVTQSTQGTNLALKIPGTRGNTDSAGIIARKDFGIELNSAHVLADQFLGSGYKDALNLILTSKEFNQQTMAKAEQTIVDQIRSKMIKNPDKFATFDMTVEAKFEVLPDDHLIDTLKAVKKDITKEELIKTLEKLQGKQDPRRCELVQYAAKIKLDGKPSGVFFAETDHGDKWLDKLFGK